MTGSLHVLLSASCLAIVAGLAGMAYQLAKRSPVPRPTLGGRGLKRAQALAAGGLFATSEPLIRYVAAWFRGAPVVGLRRRFARLLTESGDYLGLSEDELMAAVALSGVALGSTAALLCATLDLPMVLAPAGAAIGGVWPWFRVLASAKSRAKRVTRTLPGVIELASMCMGAGLDFPGSLRRIVDSASDPREPIVEELKRVLKEIELGHTRQSAMEAFSKRIPTDEVRELVNSVTQAEDKGTPLSRVLTIQAQTLRLRRSIEAEQTASEAALMLVGPMALIFLCVIVLLLGPVVLRAMTGSLEPI